MLKILINIVLAVFLIYTTLLIFAYFIAIYFKIFEPTIKNLNTKEITIASPIAILFATADYFIIKGFVKQYKAYKEK